MVYSESLFIASKCCCVHAKVDDFCESRFLSHPRASLKTRQHATQQRRPADRQDKTPLVSGLSYLQVGSAARWWLDQRSPGLKISITAKIARPETSHCGALGSTNFDASSDRKTLASQKAAEGKLNVMMTRQRSNFSHCATLIATIVRL